MFDSFDVMAWFMSVKRWENVVLRDPFRILRLRSAQHDANFGLFAISDLLISFASLLLMWTECVCEVTLQSHGGTMEVNMAPRVEVSMPGHFCVWIDLRLRSISQLNKVPATHNYKCLIPSSFDNRWLATHTSFYSTYYIRQLLSVGLIHSTVGLTFPFNANPHVT